MTFPNAYCLPFPLTQKMIYPLLTLNENPPFAGESVGYRQRTPYERKNKTMQKNSITMPQVNKARIAFTQKKMTAYGGLALIASLPAPTSMGSCASLNQMQKIERLRQAVPCKRSACLSPGQTVSTYLARIIRAEVPAIPAFPFGEVCGMGRWGRSSIFQFIPSAGVTSSY